MCFIPHRSIGVTNRTHPLFVGNTNNAFNFVTDILAKKTENRQTDRSLLGDYHQHYDLSKILVVSQIEKVACW